MKRTVVRDVHIDAAFAATGQAHLFDTSRTTNERQIRSKTCFYFRGIKMRRQSPEWLCCKSDVVDVDVDHYADLAASTISLSATDYLSALVFLFYEDLLWNC